MRHIEILHMTGVSEEKGSRLKHELNFWKGSGPYDSIYLYWHWKIGTHSTKRVKCIFSAPEERHFLEDSRRSWSGAPMEHI